MGHLVGTRCNVARTFAPVIEIVPDEAAIIAGAAEHQHIGIGLERLDQSPGEQFAERIAKHGYEDRRIDLGGRGVGDDDRRLNRRTLSDDRAGHVLRNDLRLWLRREEP